MGHNLKLGVWFELADDVSQTVKPPGEGPCIKHLSAPRNTEDKKKAGDERLLANHGAATHHVFGWPIFHMWNFMASMVTSSSVYI